MINKSAFTPPDDINVHIWRYMDFTKFVSMLQNGGLFFSRADKLGDAFEGFYPKATEEAKQGTRSVIAEVFGELALPYLYNIDRKKVERGRQYVMVNCWHINDYESAAMWKTYAKSNEAVAIRSRYSTLRSCLDTSVNVSIVRYVDEKTFISEYSCRPEEQIFIPFVHKRRFFSYEQELRAIFTDLSEEERVELVKNSKPQIKTAPLDIGKWHEINLNELVEELFVAPTAPVWFLDLVNNISKKFGLNKIATQSSLDAVP